MRIARDTLDGTRQAWRDTAHSPIGPVTQAALAALLVAAAKGVLVTAGWQVLDVPVNILTGMLGAVVFTLAIILGGVLADFKEAERGLGEMASTMRRLWWDLALAGLAPASVVAARARVRTFAETALANARHGQRWRLRGLHDALDGIDRELAAATHVGSTARTVQAGLANLTRLTDRLEAIVETTFMRSGYVFSAASIALVLAGFLLVPMGSAAASALLVGLAAFLLIGLYLLVRDLDNPLDGSVRVGVQQLEKLVAHLAAQPTDPGATPAVAVAPLLVPQQSDS